MARPNWEYIRVDVLLPDNHKLDCLKRAAKWTLLELWCYCGQHLTDGFIRDAKWTRFGTSSDRAAIVAAGLAERTDGGWQMHDYLDHQRSRAEVEALRKKRSEAGRKGGMAKASGKQMLEQTLEPMPKQNSGKAVAEAEAEAEVLMADVVSHPSAGNARAPDLTDLNTSMTMIITDEIRSATGRTVTAEWAQGIASTILKGRQPDDPVAYARAVIRNDKNPRERFLPGAATHPSARTPAEAAFAAGIIPNGRPADPHAVAAIAAQTRQALRKESAQ